MRFSDDRLSHVAHLIFEHLRDEGLVAYPRDDRGLQGIKDALHHFFRLEDGVDTRVVEKIRSQKRGILEGGRDWEILYQKYFAEEWQKLGH